MKNKINLALQILPKSSTKHPYAIIDEAIRVIRESGLKYEVSPFETVVEGDYDSIMELVKKAQQACYDSGADSLMCFIKIQSSTKDVSIEDKMEKYR